MFDLSPVDSDIVKEATYILSHRFEIAVIVKSIIILSESSRRNLVLRIMLKSPSNDVPKSVILKQSIIKNSEDDKDAIGRFSRDWAGLEFLSHFETHIPIAPKFYGGSSKHRFVLLEDLGHVHISLVDFLMGQDRRATKKALKRYMEVMAKLHGTSKKISKNYHTIIERLNPNSLTWQDDFDDMHSKISAVLSKFSISLGLDLKNEINHVLNDIRLTDKSEGF